jgi:hypothetical protein
MTHRYHLLITPSLASGNVIVERIGSAAWLLPWSTGRSRHRATIVIGAALRRLRIDGWIVRVQLVALDLDQQLAEWACLIVAREVASGLPPTFDWVAARTCSADIALLPVQHSIVETISADLEGLDDTNDAAFVGSPSWLARLREWADAALAPSGAQITAVEQYRATPGVAVLGFHTNGPDVFVRASRVGGPASARALSVLHAALGPYAPEVLAIDEARGWLLTACARGRPLSSADDAPLPAVVRALAHAGRMLAGSVPALVATGVPIVNFVEMEHDLSGLLAMLENRPTLCRREELDEARLALAALCREWRDSACPPFWCHGDPAPQNIFVDGDQISFIDLERSFIGPPALGLQLLLEGLADVGLGLADVKIDDARLRRTLPLAARTSRVLRSWLDLKDTPAKVASGEIRCPLEPLLERGALTLVRRLLGRSPLGDLGRGAPEQHAGADRDRAIA